MSKNFVMIVEDDGDIRDSLDEVIASEGYSAVLAENGKVALEILNSCSNLPCLILLDLMMPIMDGRMFIKTIQEIPAFKEIPIVVITAGGNDNIDGKLAGFMKKPLDLDEVLKFVEKYCS